MSLASASGTPASFARAYTASLMLPLTIPTPDAAPRAPITGIPAPDAAAAANGSAEPVTLASVSSGLTANERAAALTSSQIPLPSASLRIAAAVFSSSRDWADVRLSAYWATVSSALEAMFSAPNTSVKLLPVLANPETTLSGMSAAPANNPPTTGIFSRRFSSSLGP